MDTTNPSPPRPNGTTQTPHSDAVASIVAAETDWTVVQTPVADAKGKGPSRNAGPSGNPGSSLTAGPSHAGPS
ncbi:hypothetical protein V494_04992, partial [Pseudogymnoascus sp. VKM F-4513 (FW-928)]